MFRFFNLNKEESKGKHKKSASTDDKIQDFINEVASEVGVSETGENRSSREGEKLGQKIIEEVKKRT